MNNLVLQLLLLFVQRQIGKFASETDWDKVAKDAGERLAKLLPGDMFDQAARITAETVVRICGELVGDGTPVKKAFAQAVAKAGA